MNYKRCFCVQAVCLDHVAGQVVLPKNHWNRLACWLLALCSHAVIDLLLRRLGDLDNSRTANAITVLSISSSICTRVLIIKEWRIVSVFSVSYQDFFFFSSCVSCINIYNLKIHIFVYDYSIDIVVVVAEHNSSNLPAFAIVISIGDRRRKPAGRRTRLDPDRRSSHEVIQRRILGIWWAAWTSHETQTSQCVVVRTFDQWLLQVRPFL